MRLRGKESGDLRGSRGMIVNPYVPLSKIEKNRGFYSPVYLLQPCSRIELL